jgi:hypothetical protein
MTRPSYSWLLRRRNLMRVGRLSVILTFVGFICACSSPAKRFDQRAAALGLQRDVVEGSGFEHVLFWNHSDSIDRALYIYFDGDGTPFDGVVAAIDPTPRNSLTLELLALDPGPAVYVGRPCYHGTWSTDRCIEELWTTGRYSERVVISLRAVIDKIASRRPIGEVVLVGYSGGGTLAMLIAEQFPRVKAVVTIAANLDIDAWADHHGIPRLLGSLNPAKRHSFQNALQRHYVGEKDRAVPPEVTKAGTRSPAKLLVVSGFDHICCWRKLWPSILMDLRSTLQVHICADKP